MWQAIIYGAGDLRIEECPCGTGSIGEDSVYVETEVTSFSTGTDLGNYLGRSTEVPGSPGYPRSVGYSNVGLISRVGSAVTRFRARDRVFAMRPHQSAYIARETDLLVRVPDSVSSEVASLAYHTQLGLVALQQVNYRPGERVTVVGLGAIGLCAVALARAMGAEVSAVGNSPVRTDAASAIGASEPVTGADVVILTANTWQAYRTALEIATIRGRVSVLSFPGRSQSAPDFNPLDPQWLYAKQLTIQGAGMSPRVECEPHDIRFNLRRNLEYILDLMASGRLDLRLLITHRFPWRQMQQAYELAKAHDKNLIAAVFDWRAS